MKLTYKFIITFFIFVYCLTVNAQKQVAVYVSGNQEPEIKKVLGSKMVSYITKSDEYTAIERTSDFLRALNAEHDYQTSGEVSNSQIVALGGQFGAEYVAVLDISELFEELFVAARLVNVKTAQVESSFEASSPATNMNSLTNLASNVADGLIFEPLRLKTQKEEAEKERQRQNRAKIQAELRQQAINNLMPPNSVIFKGRIYITTPYKVSYYLDGNNDLKVNFNIPSGYLIASAMDVTELLKGGIYLPDDVILAFSNYVQHGEKFNYRKKEGYWTQPIMKIDTRFTNSLKTVFNNWVAVTKMVNGKLELQNVRDVYAIAYRDFFPESEIQKEMNRISHNY